MEEVSKDKDEASEKISRLTKVVEPVNTSKTSKCKKRTKQKDFLKPKGFSYGERCRLNYVEEARLAKTAYCAYWLEGQCRV